MVYLPPRGVWYGSEGEVQAPGGRAGGLGAVAALATGGHRAGRERPRAPVVVVEATTLMEGVVPPVRPPLTVAPAAELDFEDLVRELVDVSAMPGSTRSRTRATSPCAAGSSTSSPPPKRYPVRIEFWGDEVESLRSFSVYLPALLGPVESVRLYAAAEAPGTDPVSIVSLLPGGHAWSSGPTRRGPAARVEAFQSDLADVLGEHGWGGARTLTWAEVEAGLGRSFRTVTLEFAGPDRGR